MPEQERVIITQAVYVASAVKREQYPEEKMPEIVFIGRSNVGKSSLINLSASAATSGGDASWGASLGYRMAF
mgnify:CR=1 FL=1